MIGRSRLSDLTMVHIPVLVRKEVVGVVEYIGATLREDPEYFALFCERVARHCVLLQEMAKGRSRATDNEPALQALIEVMTDGVSVVHDSKFVYVNDGFRKLFGYTSADELAGKSIRIIVAPEDRDRVMETSRNRFSGMKVPSRYEYKGVRKNGTVFDVEVVVSVLQYKGQPAVVAVHRDVTLHKAIEKELQQSEQMFRNVIDGVLTVGDALVITNLEGKVLQVNSEFERLTGIKKTDALGKEFPYEWLLDEEMSRYVLWIKELREKKSLRDFDIHWRHTDGKVISVSMNTTLLYNALGRPVAMMNMARDITGRKKLEEENRLQFDRLRVLYELSRTLTSLLRINEISDAVYRHLVQILSFDSFFIDLYDAATGSIRNIICYDTIHNVRVRIPSESVEASLEPGTGIAKVIAARESLLEFRKESDISLPEHPFGDTSRRAMSLLYIPMFSKDKIIGVLSIQSYTVNVYNESHVHLLESFANLAAIAFEKAKLYEETISKSLQLQNRNKELDDFTYVVSHDLKEPLITVEGYSRILLKEHIQEKNSAASEYIHSIIESCSRMKDLIDDLLVLSRVSRLSEMMETVSLNDVLNEVLDDLKFSLQEKHISISTPAQYPSYKCNPTQIKLVFRNLVSNALKFNKSENPFIKITMQESEKRILCSIQDNGVGIEKRFFDKIFVIFQRLNPEYDGSGAGLAIVKKIIELYEGQIWLESEVGKGTTFYFSLPK
jgi:PAS domain S-box-containing protein